MVRDGGKNEGRGWREKVKDGKVMGVLSLMLLKKENDFFFWSKEKEKMITKIKIYHYAKILRVYHENKIRSEEHTSELQSP